MVQKGQGMGVQWVGGAKGRGTQRVVGKRAKGLGEREPKALGLDNCAGACIGPVCVHSLRRC